MSDSDKFLLETIKSFYNDSTHSDVVLDVNGDKYYLLLPLIKKYAPLLHKEIEETPVNPPVTSPELSEVLSNITTLFSKLQNKKSVTLPNISVTKEVISVVFETMYGKPLEISTNLASVYVLSTRFGMDHLTTQCVEKFRKDSVNLDTLLEDYKKVVTSGSPLVKLWAQVLQENLWYFPEDKLMEFVAKLSYDDLFKLLNNPTLESYSDRMYELIVHWNSVNGDTSKMASLLGLVKLENLSIDILTTKVKHNPFVSQEAYINALEMQLNSNHRVNGLTRTMFGIGRLNGYYHNYRLLTKAEVETSKFKDLFVKTYTKFKAIYCLDTFGADVVCCVTHPLIVMDGWWLRMENDAVDVAKGTMVQLSATNRTAKETLENISTIVVGVREIYSSAQNTGLFVWDQIKFD